MAPLARVVKLIAGLIAGLLVLAIVLNALGANEGNAIVSAIMDAGSFFAKPFASLFELDSQKLQMAVNWGIAALVYLLIGAVIARLLGGIRRPARRHRRGAVRA